MKTAPDANPGPGSKRNLYKTLNERMWIRVLRVIRGKEVLSALCLKSYLPAGFGPAARTSSGASNFSKLR